MGLQMLGALVSLAGTVGSTIAAVQQRRGAAQTYDVSAQASELEAESALESAGFEERQARRASALQIAKIPATAAAAGLETTSGSPLLLELDAVKQAELEALNIRRGGALEAMSSRYGASIARAQGRNIRRGIPGVIAGGGIRSASVLSDWLYRRAGTNGLPPYRGGYD